MGKRKKATNVVKIDLGDIFKKEEALPVLVQHLSKDHRQIEQTVHNIPVLQPSQPPQPNPLSFNPSEKQTGDFDQFRQILDLMR